MELRFDGGDIISQTLSVVNGVATVDKIHVPDFKLWSMGEPNLHTLTVSLADGSDAIHVRFGSVDTCDV